MDFTAACCAYSLLGMMMVFFGVGHATAIVPVSLEVGGALSGGAFGLFICAIAAAKFRLHFELFVFSTWSSFWAALGFGQLFSLFTSLPYAERHSLGIFYACWLINAIFVAGAAVNEPWPVRIGWALKSVGLACLTLASFLNSQPAGIAAAVFFVIGGLVLFYYGWARATELVFSGVLPYGAVESSKSVLFTTADEDGVLQPCPIREKSKTFNSAFGAGLLAFGVSNVYHTIMQVYGRQDTVMYSQSFFFAGILQYAIGAIMASRGEIISIAGFCVFGMYWWGTVISEVARFFIPDCPAPSNFAAAANNWMWALFVTALGTLGYANYRQDIASNTCLYFMGLGNLLMGFFHFYPSITLLRICIGLFIAGGLSAWYFANVVFLNDRWGRCVIPLGLDDFLCRSSISRRHSVSVSESQSCSV